MFRERLPRHCDVYRPAATTRPNVTERINQPADELTNELTNKHDGSQYLLADVIMLLQGVRRQQN